MPRLPQSLVQKARNISPLLPLILRATRTLPSAINELRWLKEHIKSREPQLCKLKSKKILFELVRRRARGEPLQYILGSQPFGNLDIKCKRGVLIPRPESEAYTLHLAKLIKTDKLHHSITRIYSHPSRKLKEGTNRSVSKLRILDACSGSGAISLLLRSALRKPCVPTSEIFICGFDNSEEAIALAIQNRERNIKLANLPPNAVTSIQYRQRDIFEEFRPNEQMWDIIISNPPYISREAYDHETSRSVRNYEPLSALVPRVPRRAFGVEGELEDVFYRRLVDLHHITFSKVLLMEVADASQAVRVVKIIQNHPKVGKNSCYQFWRDNPGAQPDPKKISKVDIEGVTVPIMGAGKVRSVLVTRIDDGKPKAGRDYLIKRIKFTPSAPPTQTTPKLNLFGPPELKATWKNLNSSVGTEGRATRAMAMGWELRRKSSERKDSQEFPSKKSLAEERRQVINATQDLERPMKYQLKRSRSSPNDDFEPFSFRQNRF